MSAEEIARALYEQMVAGGYPFMGVELVEDVEGFPRVELWWDTRQVQMVIVCVSSPPDPLSASQRGGEMLDAAMKVAIAVAAEVEAEGNGACLAEICTRVADKNLFSEWMFVMMEASS